MIRSFSRRIHLVYPESQLKESACTPEVRLWWGLGEEGEGHIVGCSLNIANSLTSSKALRCSVVGALQHALAQGQVPVVFCAVLFEVFSGHVLCRALLELHVSKAALFSRSLEEKQN